MWEVISNGHVCTYEPRSAQCSLPLCALCPYSVLRTLCRRFMSIIFFQHQAAAHALVSRRSVFFLLSACHYSACSLRFRLVFVFFYLPLFHHHFHSWHDNYCPLPTLLCYSACAYINTVWMFVMCMYPSTLTCLMLCLLLCYCCCNPNPDLLLCHVVVFHKLVYI